MKERVISALKVISMLCISMACITYMYIKEGNDKVITEKEIIITTDTIYCNKNKTFEDSLYQELSANNIYYPEIVYAQAILETGYFKSRLCVENNNLFGLYNSKKKCYYKFNHWSESVTAYKKWIQNKYNPPEDYYDFLKRINYAENSNYINVLKQIVQSENDKRRYTRRDISS